MKRLGLCLLAFALFCVVARGDQPSQPAYAIAIQAATKAISEGRLAEARKYALEAKEAWPASSDAALILKATDATSTKADPSTKDADAKPAVGVFTQPNLNTLMGLIGILSAVYLKITKHNAGEPIALPAPDLSKATADQLRAELAKRPPT